MPLGGPMSAAHRPQASGHRAPMPPDVASMPPSSGRRIRRRRGLGAREALRSDAPPHNVKMTFALDTGYYLANIQVRNTDQQGRTVLEGVSPAPWLYVRLPPGRYTAHANVDNCTLAWRLSVAANGERLAHFRWPASVARSGGEVEPTLRTLSASAEGSSR